MTAWADFVGKLKDTATQAEFAARSGVDQATVSRWLKGGAPGKPEQVADLARSNYANVLAAFVAAGFITQEEAERGLSECDGRSTSELEDDEP